MTNKEAAIQYARNGWPIFPLHHVNADGVCSCGGQDGCKPGKHPRLNAWPSEVCDLATVEAWWTQWPDANIGMRLENLTVLDIDVSGDKQGAESLRKLEAAYEPLDKYSRLRQRSGSGGVHEVYKDVTGVGMRRKLQPLYPDLEVFVGSGAYIVVAPSLHVLGGRYEWTDTANPLNTCRDQIQLAEPPAWLLSIPSGKKAENLAKVAKARAGRKSLDTILDEALERVKAGEARHNVTMSWLGIAKVIGYSRDESLVRLSGWVDAVNKLVVDKGRRFTMKECEACLRDVYNKEAAEEEKDEGGEKSQADEILDLCADFEYFKSGPADDAYIRITVEDHHEVHLAATAAQGPTSKLRKILTQRFLKKCNRAPAPEALNAAANTIAAWCDEGQKMETFVRFARATDAIYLDLANDSWQAVKITADGWEVISNPPVLFRRGGGAEPLPLPVKGGSLNTLRGLINTGEDDNWCLMLAWLVGCFQPVGAFTLLVVEGEKGSAKTTTSELLITMVDPSGAPLVGPPKNEEGAVINAMHTGVLGYDNLKTVRAEMSDIFCRFSSGIGYKARTLYETTGITVVKLRLPLLLNGISDCIMQPDLLDRSIKLWLPFIAKAGRTTIAAVKAEFEEQHPAILGALLDVVSTGLRNLSTTVVADAPRMSDFATWVVACETALPWEPGAFLRAYRANQRRASADALELDDVGSALVKYAEQRLTPDVPAVVRLEDLLEGINEVTQRDFKDMRNWPSNAQGMAYRLSKLAGDLRERGIHIRKLKRDGDGARYEIRREGGSQGKLAMLPIQAPAPADWPSDDDAPVAA
jgi:hypothetical protein